jgi:DNA-binding PadR family transcriptional regulator
MEMRGLVESRWEKVEGGPERRVYRLTSKGVEALRMGLQSIVKRRRLFDDLVSFYYEKFEGAAREGGGEKDV